MPELAGERLWRGWRLAAAAAICVVAAALLAPVIGIAGVYRDMTQFYRSQPPLACPALAEEGMGDRRHREFAVVNFYVGHVMDRTGYSHMSVYVAMHNLAAHIVAKRVLTDERLHDAALRTPCGFRR